MATIEHVRDTLLLKGLGKPLPLNAVDWKVKQELPSASNSKVQQETLEVIRTLVDDGLFRLGDVDEHRFVASKQSLDRSMHKISRRYVKNYEKPRGWMYSAWMKLTPKGEQLALSLEEQGVDFFRDRCDITEDFAAEGMAELKHFRAQVAASQHDGDLISRAVA